MLIILQSYLAVSRTQNEADYEPVRHAINEVDTVIARERGRWDLFVRKNRSSERENDRDLSDHCLSVFWIRESSISGRIK